MAGGWDGDRTFPASSLMVVAGGRMWSRMMTDAFLSCGAWFI